MIAESEASKEVSAEAASIDRSGDKAGLPSLPHQFSEESLKSKFKSAESDARSLVPDVTTEQGRKDIKDNARKVAASNKALDTPMRDYLRVIKAQPKVLEKNARESKARFDELKADILKPLEEAQSEQDEIIAWLNSAIADCAHPHITSEVLKDFIGDINSYSVDKIWPELKKKFTVAHEAALTTATVTLERITEAEKQAARLAQLEADAAAQRQKDHDREVAEKAAEKARVDAEAKAQKDREAVERRAVEARQREENAKASEAKAIRDAELAEESRIKAAAQAKVDAENERIAAEKRQAAAVELAQRQEVQRMAMEEAEQVAQAKARAADKEHRIKINRAAMADFIAAGLNVNDGDDIEGLAKQIITVIAQGKIRNVSIQY